jgi:protein ImuB
MARLHHKRFLPDREFSLPPPEAVSAHAQIEPPAAAAPASQRLWLCLYLQDLPLEILARPADVPHAVLSGEGRRARILLCDSLAAALGVRPGMSVNAALALAPRLQIEPRDARLEQQALAHLASWAVQFTPVVSPDSGHALLLEVASSLKFFGGLDGLRSTLSSGVRGQGHAVTIAAAPTARAALWFARNGGAITVTERARLRAALAGLPLACLGWPEQALGTLRRIGAKYVGDCLRLPRDGFARRVGAGLLHELDEAFGRRAEVRANHRPPQRFHDVLELAAEANGSTAVLSALQVLLDRLRRHLSVRQAGAEVLWISLRHRAAADTRLRIGLLRPGTDIGHLLHLAELHLAAACLPAPVVAVELQADAAPLAAVSGDLLGDGRDHGELRAALVERLRARLGFHAVHGIGAAPGHRPERAWHRVAEPHCGYARRDHRLALRPQRPLWLLEDPLPLDSRLGQPCFQGLLVTADGPERIESGWWDGHDVRRDYYLMRNARGALLWVFRDGRSGAWYLHGVFA